MTNKKDKELEKIKSLIKKSTKSLNIQKELFGIAELWYKKGEKKATNRAIKILEWIIERDPTAEKCRKVMEQAIKEIKNE